MLSLVHLQEYLRFNTRHDHEVVSFPPFTLFFHPTNARSWANYAIPDASEDREWSAGLTSLLPLFAKHNRTPCLRFIEEVFPSLPPLLCAAGWSETERPQIMMGTPETVQPAPQIVDLEILTLSHESSIAEILEGLDTNALGFDPHAERATIWEAEEFRHSLMLSRAFTARLLEHPVGAGMFTPIHEGVTELVGITTLESFRRRGIAAALTASMTQAAFAQGASVVFLMAGNAQAGRVYERVGFRPAATHVVYERS